MRIISLSLAALLLCGCAPKSVEVSPAVAGMQQEHLEPKMYLEEKPTKEFALKKERESFELEKIKLLKQIDDNKKLAEEMKRKAEQGSPIGLHEV